MAFPGLILLVWPEVAAEPEKLNVTFANQN
jgi:hypothetical protein